jgi:beta-alanine--pyruvate transaminase
MSAHVDVHLSIIIDTFRSTQAVFEQSVDFLYHRALLALVIQGFSMSAQLSPVPSHGELDAFWMPFTANRQFKSGPRLLARAEGMHYWTADGREVMDGVSGLWCVNAGHGRREITEAVTKQLGTMEFAPAFQMGHPIAFELANRLSTISPPGLDRIFFTNSGSESVDTALKIALAYHRAKGAGQRTRFIGREKGYHGVGFGGTSVGGMVNNRKVFASAMLPGVDHLAHTLDIEHNAYSRGLPQWGAHLANELERLIGLHDASTIAAVIVEPIAGSGGVLLPPVGYLKRLREICDKNDILLIFDEVITGFGRVGKPFASLAFDVTPDLMTTAKGLTNGAIPMGAVFAHRKIHDACMQGPEGAIELFHGYTYSAHPVACAAALATLDVYQKEGLLTRAASLSPQWENALHALRGLPHVIDIRNYGLIGAVELEPRAGKPGTRAFEIFTKCFERGIMVRQTGDTIAMAPPLIIEPKQITRLVETLGSVIRETP